MMQEKLLLLRKRHGLSQSDLAKRLGMSKTQFGLKERGIYEFTSDEMFEASELFNEKIEDIFLPRGHQNGDKEKA